MNHRSFQPGQVWAGISPTAALLETQWNLELRHHLFSFDLPKLAFTNDDWEALDWNAREALHLNGKFSAIPVWLRTFFLPQNRINIHLIRALVKLLGAWQQWSLMPYVRTLNTLPSLAETNFSLNQAMSRLEIAEEKHNSLASKKQLFQQISIRQWRYYQQVASLFNDIDPLVTGASVFLKGNSLQLESVQRLQNDLVWHGKELRRRMNVFGDRPDLFARIQLPGFEINRLIGTNCLIHSGFLRELMKIS